MWPWPETARPGARRTRAGEQPRQQRLPHVTAQEGPLTSPPHHSAPSSFWNPFPGAGLVTTELALNSPKAGPPTVTPTSLRRCALLPRCPRTYCFMASSLESMLSCFPFISCTSVNSLVTLSWRIFMSSLRRVDTWVPGGAVTEMAWGWGGI